MDLFIEKHWKKNMRHEILKSIGKKEYATGNFVKSLGEG
jgi:hypothetical protein